MKCNKLISVMVPVYQVEEYLEQCLESIINQTYKNLEIIIVDDGSKDLSGEICDRYAREDCRIKVIHKQNGGLVSARKAAMDYCHGEYIAFADSDDWNELDMYEKLLDEMESNKADVVICSHYQHYMGTEKIIRNYVKPGVYKEEALETNLFSRMMYEPSIGYWGVSPACWDKLLKTEVVKRHQMDVDDRIWDGEDHAFIYSVLLEAQCICVLDEPLYHHRIREGSVAVGYDPRCFERFSYLLNNMQKKLSNCKYWSLVKDQFYRDMRWFVLKHIGCELGVDPFDEINNMHAFLFPFEEVNKGENIILYGAGNVGKTFFRQLMTSNYCNVIAWFDANYTNFNGMYKIENPELIGDYNADAVVIAVNDEEVYSSIKEYIAPKINERVRIVWKNPKVKTIEKSNI